tara:strand:+ start:427 stop:552 length:126 start_codon:yes stop_codon:yes gene_type:complete
MLISVIMNKHKLMVNLIEKTRSKNNINDKKISTLFDELSKK